MVLHPPSLRPIAESSTLFCPSVISIGRTKQPALAADARSCSVATAMLNRFASLPLSNTPSTVGQPANFRGIAGGFRGYPLAYDDPVVIIKNGITNGN